jgi:poly-gamma-glutamate synthesis protein (capsule biosynthesis protein)
VSKTVNSGVEGHIAPQHQLIFLFFPLLFVLLGLMATIPTPPASSVNQINLSAYPWLYLREGKMPAPGERLVELIAVGDVMLGRGVGDISDVFDKLAPLLVSADISMGNLEGVIDSAGSALEGPFGISYYPYSLVAPPHATALLQGAGFDLLGLANNHALDLGDLGLAETVSRLETEGMEVVGAGRGLPEAYMPIVRKFDRTNIAFLAFNAISFPEQFSKNDSFREDSGWRVAELDSQKALEAIRFAHSRADIVVVSVHWGDEYSPQAYPWQRDAAREMRDAGADLIIGHHPHVVQATQVFEPAGQDQSRRSGFVAFSLGNFIFDQRREHTRQGLILRAFFDRDGLRAVQALPVWAGLHPRLMTSDESQSLLARIIPPPKRLGFECDRKGCWPIASIQQDQTGLFWAGQIDLTGDGVPELVQRQAGRVMVYHGNVLAWESPPTWRVVDLALGDPNDDGRNEMLLALEKPDANGKMTSHPFVIGFRGGIYRQLWGGSAVSDAINEVELGDLDGDGAQELVVIETHDDGRQAVAVWRWHGWGFSLVWRSSLSRYENLALVRDASGRLQIDVGEKYVSYCELQEDVIR